MNDDRPIGVFDSGVGGLTVLRAIHDQLPLESTIYLGDLAYFPYGPKSATEVRERAATVAEYLERSEVKALVVACNTATAAALDRVIEVTSVPVVGVVKPGAQVAVERSKSKCIGVVATEGTVRSGAYRTAVLALCSEATVHELGCGELVDLVEQGAMGSPEVASVVQMAMTSLRDRANCDTVILGCTHFPLVRADFERVAGSVAIVDSASATAATLKEVLEAQALTRYHAEPTHTFIVTAHADAFIRQARFLFGEHIHAHIVDVQPPRFLRAASV